MDHLSDHEQSSKNEYLKRIKVFLEHLCDLVAVTCNWKNTFGFLVNLSEWLLKWTMSVSERHRDMVGWRANGFCCGLQKRSKGRTTMGKAWWWCRSLLAARRIQVDYNDNMIGTKKRFQIGVNTMYKNSVNDLQTLDWADLLAFISTNHIHPCPESTAQVRL